ncbi:lamin-B2-like isoform X1 [Biomphalaria pfeifferi]|uniref:Lamin-B2-like isoform X1 n=1 Tax=Biomphalaria pfeifferi TaxID=112525 RepID=A0AAD8C9A7_BIOPF|nr:lamin-B2-like isoform X1 [Biomphalaria pfeifferi]
MSYFGGLSENLTNQAHQSRLQEKEELQHLNDRFLNYVGHIRQLSQQVNIHDSSAFIKSTQILEDEIVNLKSLYESEIEKLRSEVVEVLHEKHALHSQQNKQQQCIDELQQRLAIETEKNRNHLNEINALQKKIIEGEIQNAKLVSERPEAKVEHLHRNIENLMREAEQWKHRYDYEKIARQEAEDKLQQNRKKIEFSEQVYKQQITDYQTRLDTATSTILSLEANVRDLSISDLSVADLLKQIRDTSELEMRKYQMESEEMFSRNLSILKAQIDNDAETIKNLSQEKAELFGKAERSEASENIKQLERKFREVQETLVLKMREMVHSREACLPLKAEIESLKILLEDEERRLHVPVGISSAQPPTFQELPSLNSELSNQSFNALQNALSNHIQSKSGQQQNLADARKANLLKTTPLSNNSPILRMNSSPTHSSYVNLSSACPTQHCVTEVVNSYYPCVDNDHVLDNIYASNGLQATEDEPVNNCYTNPYISEEYSRPLTEVSYRYESTPSVSRVYLENDQQHKTRAQSAPILLERNAQESQCEDTDQLKTQQSASKATDEDAFNQLFKDFKKETLFPKIRPKSSPLERPLPSTFQDYNVTNSSAVGDLKIIEVSQDGKYVRLLNDGPSDIELGGFMIQQNVDGHPVAAFRFPSKVKFPSDSTVTVWSGVNDSQCHNPPHEFYWKELYRWGKGPECTTLLCRPNGQAVAWSTAAHRVTREAYIESSKDGKKSDDKSFSSKDEKLCENLTKIKTNIDILKSEPIFLRREKQQPPSLSAAKHPHGHTPDACIHPHSNLPSTFRSGNDADTNSLQLRPQTCHSEPSNGKSTWGTPQRMGSAPLRKMEGNQDIKNKMVGSLRLTPPKHYLSPLQEQLIDETSNYARASYLIPIKS